jgi:hypothetical protein
VIGSAATISILTSGVVVVVGLLGIAAFMSWQNRRRDERLRRDLQARAFSEGYHAARGLGWPQEAREPPLLPPVNELPTQVIELPQVDLESLVRLLERVDELAVELRGVADELQRAAQVGLEEIASPTSSASAARL